MVPKPISRSCVQDFRAVLVKLYLMLWRNNLLSIRHIYSTVFEIFVPVWFFLLLTLSRKEAQNTVYNPTQMNSTVHRYFENEFFTPPYGPQLTRALAFSPNKTVFAEFMYNAFANERLHSNNTHFFDNLTVIAVNTAVDLEQLLKTNRTIIAGIQFNHEGENNLTTLPHHLSYSLRFPAMMRQFNMPWPTDILYKEQAFYRYPRNQPEWDFYNREGFSTLQSRMMNEMIRRNHLFKLSRVNIYAFPSFEDHLHFDNFQFLFIPISLIGFYYGYWSTICFIVEEKRKQLKETMKLIGISNWIYWLSLFVRKMILQAISVTVIITVIKLPLFSKAVFPNSSFYLLWLFLIIYCLSSTSLSFLFGIFFTEMKSAIPVSTIIWFLSFLPFIITHVGYKPIPDQVKIFLYMFPNTALAFGMKLIVQLEFMENGLNWSSLWQGLLPYDILNIGTIICIMMYTSIMLLIIVLYIDPIFPGAYGLAKRFYYPFKREYWRKPKNHQNSEKPATQKAGIEIIELCKAFKKRKAVVHNVSLNIYKNEITVLLGHNGSGKSTIISILTGMLKATSGTVLINGYDVQKHTDVARKSISYCPQQNSLFDELTIREHILFFSLINGMSRRAANEEVKKYVELFQLETTINKTASNLSYGTQRKLSVAIALCGQSQFVFLEHPTNGLDPAVRRSLWNVLSNEKKGRHILVTTHLPDEADMLGDRIAIITNGRLEFCGSSFFFRKRFGIYRLICVKDDGCKPNATTSLLEKWYPGVVKEPETENQLCYQLAYAKAYKFGRIFEQLEISLPQLKLKNFSVSLSAAEFAFHEFNKELETDEVTNHSLNIEENSNVHCLHGMILIPYQILAMLKKRLLCGIRDWKSFVLYNSIAIILLLPIVVDFRSFIPRGDIPSLEISIDSYKNPLIFLEDGNVTELYAKRDAANKQFYNDTLIGYKETFASMPDAELVVMENKSDILKWSKTSTLQRYRFQFIFGFSIRPVRSLLVNGMSPIHVAPLSEQYFKNSAAYPNISMTVINAPINANVKYNLPTIEFTNMEAFGIDFPIFIAIIMSIMSSAHIIFYIKERECRAKFMQFVTGVNIFVFWITSILWDLLISMSSIILIVVMLILSERIYWSETNTLWIVACIIFMFNFAMLPIICLLSLFFSKPLTGISVLSVVNTFIAMALFVNNYAIEYISAPIKTILSVLPTCALIESLSVLSNIGKKCQQDNDATDHPILPLCTMNTACCPPISFLWNEKAILNQIWFMAGTHFTVLIILLIIETDLLKQLISLLVYRVLNTVLKRRIPESKEETKSENSNSDDCANDINSEALAIGDGNGVKNKLVDFGKLAQSMSLRQLDSSNLMLEKVSKFYGRFLAVDKVSLDIHDGECVGLFGNNGTGKTTIFKMLTGEHRICSGKAFLLGWNVKCCTTCTHYIVGYCPQIDGLFDNLTVRETLRMFSLLRGIPSRYAVDMANHLDLGQHIKQNVSKLSGGNKRKLSIVIALIGNPSVLLMDQPTSCVDINTKRKLWKILNAFRDHGKSILLTSDCMKEYKSLCTRLQSVVNDVTIVDYKPTLIGLQIKVEIVQDEKPYTGDVNDFILATFRKAKLISKYQNILAYDIPISRLKWSEFFNFIEKHKRQIHIEDYFVYLK